jgi:hypothetical protein
MPELLRSEQDGEHRYRITATDRGFLITMRTPRGPGMWISAEWLHRHRETADACLDAVMAFNAAGRAMKAGLPTQAAMRRAETLSGTHSQLCDQLSDHPPVGEEVRALREEAEAAEPRLVPGFQEQ